MSQCCQGTCSPAELLGTLTLPRIQNAVGFELRGGPTQMPFKRKAEHGSSQASHASQHIFNSANPKFALLTKPVWSEVARAPVCAFLIPGTSSLPS